MPADLDPGAGPRTLCEAFARVATIDPSAVALATHDGSVSYTWGQYAARVRSIAAALHSVGVRRGDTVALMMVNRPEFHLCDTAVLHLGATPFSIYNTSSPEQIEHLFADAGNEVVITEPQFAARLIAAGARTVLCLEDHPGTASLEALEGTAGSDFDFESSWRAVEPDDLGTLIYTSGTTGPSKGVESTHAQLLAQTDALGEWFDARPGDITCSFLPCAHIADRALNQYLQLRWGVCVVSVDNPRAIGTALPLVRPTVWVATPSVWQRIRGGVEVAMAAGPAGIRDALAAAIRMAELRAAGSPVPPDLAAEVAAAEPTLLAPLRARLGMDRLRWAMVGAAPVPVETLIFFTALGVPLYEAWGMSEVAGVGTANIPGHNRVGSVGRALPGTSVCLAHDGELLFRGEQVMRGYRHLPDATSEAVDPEGWLHTGDVARIDADGYVTLIDRKKEIIINSSGKNMSPANIETTIRAGGPLIAQVVAIGDARSYVTALVVLDPDAAAAWAVEHGVIDASVAALSGDPGVHAAVAESMAAANARLSRVEQVRRFRVLPECWAPGGEELTPTMKLRRRPIAQRYAAEIEDLYAAAPSVAVHCLPAGPGR